jgi:FKBP-type peptidyl-prolyl cis-trans isomerase
MAMRFYPCLFTAALCAATLGCGAGSDEGPKAPPKVQIEDLKVGTGDEAKAGDNVVVHYTGWLTDGTKFDSSLDRKQPLTFRLGTGQVIRGWEAIEGMRVGGKRKLTIPPELGYGQQGAPPNIPPGATLVFEVELLKIQ